MRRIATLGLLAGCTAALAAPARFTSGTARVSLIELYTSEGCSSCPAADAWLSGLAGKPGLWRDFVPVEFHVNYWDRLGWADRLSSREYTDRQYAYSQLWGSGSVYTPCFVRDGREWRPAAGSAAAQAAAGILAIEVADEGVIRAEFRPASGAGPFELHVALLGCGLTSKVTAGENQGRMLGHDFVVLGLSAAPFAGSGAPLQAAARLPGASVPGAGRLALAAWVTRAGELAPLQAAGGWLP
jgi:hypothetical protein